MNDVASGEEPGVVKQKISLRRDAILIWRRAMNMK
jgi:hypothetical protein